MANILPFQELDVKEIENINNFISELWKTRKNRIEIEQNLQN